MNNNNPSFYATVFAIIKDENWNILFQKRQNTWFADWMYQLPSGHIEWEETYFEAIIRELKEELDIEVNSSCIEIKHITHWIKKWWRIYFNIYMNISSYSWKLTIKEPEKCSLLSFLDFKTENNILEDTLKVLNNIENNIYFSEIKH